MFCYYFLYFSISARGFIRNMNVLFGDILLVFIPDREIRRVVLRPPPPHPTKKNFFLVPSGLWASVWSKN